MAQQPSPAQPAPAQPTTKPSTLPSSPTPAQAATPQPTPQPTPISPADPRSMLELKLANEHAINLQHQINELINQLNSKFQAEVAKESKPLQDRINDQILIMNTEIIKIRSANKWGDDVVWDPASEQFMKMPAQPAQPAQPKK